MSSAAVLFRHVGFFKYDQYILSLFIRFFDKGYLLICPSTNRDFFTADVQPFSSGFLRFISADCFFGCIEVYFVTFDQILCRNLAVFVVPTLLLWYNMANDHILLG